MVLLEASRSLHHCTSSPAIAIVVRRNKKEGACSRAQG